MVPLVMIMSMKLADIDSMRAMTVLQSVQVMSIPRQQSAHTLVMYCIKLLRIR